MKSGRDDAEQWLKEHGLLRVELPEDVLEYLFNAMAAYHSSRSAETERQLAELAKEVGKALVIRTLRPGEELADPGEHAIVHAMLDFRNERDAAERRVKELEAERDRLTQVLRIVADKAHIHDGYAIRFAPDNEWLVCDHQWKKYDGMSDTDVVCVRCGCHGDEQPGYVFWPAT
jgi:hypothetical protein